MYGFLLHINEDGRDEEFGEPRAKNETTVNIAMTTELRFYAYLSRSSMANKRLAGSMKLFATG